MKTLKTKKTSLIGNKVIGNVESKDSRSAKKSITTELSLTALVDCFAILVIYLLVATAPGAEELIVDKSVTLPKATHSSVLTRQGVVIEIRQSRYFVDNKEVSAENLSDILRSKNPEGSNFPIIIQADKRLTYSELNPVVLSAMQAGFEKISFAVLQEDET